MFRWFNQMKLSYRLLFPNILYLLVLIVVVYFAVHTREIVQNASEKQNKMVSLSEEFRNVVLDVNDYLNGKISYEKFLDSHGTFIEQLADNKVGLDMNTTKGLLEENERLATQNTDLRKDIQQLAAVSISQSEEYIEQTVKKLVDEFSRPKLSDQQKVSVLERQVIQGAHANTTNNLDLLILLSQLNVGSGSFESDKISLLNALDKMIEQVELDIERLAGTAFAELPVNSKASIVKIIDDVHAIIRNIEAQQDIQETLVGNMLQSISNLDREGKALSEGIFKSLVNNQLNLVWILIFVIVIAVGVSIYISRKLSITLGRTIEGLGAGADQVAAASGQISNASQTLASGSSEQAASIEETSSSLEEMSAMIRTNAENSNQAKSRMDETKIVVEKVERFMGQMLNAIGEITDTSRETGKIVKTIDEIAFQTNLLALNAAVEAARAGEAGAGFAVVADEVRSLAMRAAEASKNTTSLIDGTIASVSRGNDIAQQVMEAFKENMENAGQVGGLINEIAEASNEQARGIEQMNAAVSQINTVIQDTAATAEESASAAEEMTAQAETMRGHVASLIKLMGGKNRELLRNKREKPASPASPQYRPRVPDKLESAVPKNTEMRPQQMIPMDETDFEDF